MGTANSGSDVSRTPLGALPVPCSDPVWEPWRSEASCPSSLVPLAIRAFGPGRPFGGAFFPEKADVSVCVLGGGVGRWEVLWLFTTEQC